MRKTKVVATLGPVSESKEKILQLVRAGMDVGRLNFSHGTYEEHRKKMEYIREAEDETGKTIGIMLDTKGPEIRTGDLKEDKVELKEKENIVLTGEDIKGDSSRISVTYKGLAEDIDLNDTILVDDGLIELKVIDINETEIKCKVVNGGVLKANRGINIPGKSLNLPSLTEKDKEDLLFGIEMQVNFIAASFVRKRRDVKKIKELLYNNGGEGIYVIAKIENREGVDNIDEILEIADGIMVARGDLGVEILPEKVPVIQKNIINKCNKVAKPVITATQMLNSMIENPRPTRAEASDVANAIFDGTDAIMLSGETAMGKYPVASLETMVNIANEIEKSSSYQEILCSRNEIPSSDTVTEAISYASCKTAMDLRAKCIITSTNSGLTARMVSKNRPFPSIIAVTPNREVKHYLTLVWGVYPMEVVESKTTDEMIENAIKAVKNRDIVKDGDLVTITAGVPVGISGTTNLIEVIRI
ncbi:MAG: pyruvate kinase [Halanaerobiales bacterium]